MMDQTTGQRFQCLGLSGALDIPYPDDKVILEYVFPNHTRYQLHSKTRVADFEPNSVSECPIEMSVWYDNFEGKEPRPEMILKPVALFRDPFRRGRHKIVLSEFWETLEKASVINTRPSCVSVMDKIKHLEPWFGIEQEYMIKDQSGTPIGHETGVRDNGYHTCLGKTSTTGFERELAELHLKACIYAGVKMYGSNREDSISQWEYQVGPCEGVTIGDHLHVSRYILIRIAEMMGVEISLEPIPYPSTGSGGHINFSTKYMRGENGIRHINEAIETLSNSNQKRLYSMYDPRFGMDMESRLNNQRWSPGHTFSSDVGYKQTCTVRIPTLVNLHGKGYFEDRRPPSHCDPYAAIEGLVRACILKEF